MAFVIMATVHQALKEKFLNCFLNEVLQK